MDIKQCPCGEIPEKLCIKYANECFIKSAAWLARDLDYDPENPPTERQVENWRREVMRIIGQHEAAHQRIAELEDNEQALHGLMEAKDNRIKRLDAALAECQEEIKALRDSWLNGVKYDEKLDLYKVVWTERQIKKAEKAAKEICKKLKIARAGE